MNEGKELVEYNSELPVIDVAKNNLVDLDVKLIVNRVRRQQIIAAFGAYWRFASLAVAFAAIFFLIYFCLRDSDRPPADVEVQLPQDHIGQTNEDTVFNGLESSTPSVVALPILIDEAKTDIKVEEYFGLQDNVQLIFDPEAVKVLIVHSHTSEMVSESMSVVEAGEVTAEILASAGVKVIHSMIVHDDEGRIGAYNRMKETVNNNKTEDSEIVLVIDIHSSYDNTPITFDVGVSSEHAWKENLGMVSAIFDKIENKDCVVRLLPQTLGQDSGILTISVAIGSEKADDSYARKQIADLALGIAGLFIQNTPDRSGVFAYINSNLEAGIPVVDAITGIKCEGAECFPSVLIFEVFPVL